MNKFHSQLLAKALDLFPSLTEEDLKPYLLRSRATSAYDAVTLLARSVGVAFDQHQDEGSCPSTEQVQTALERNMVGSIAHNVDKLNPFLLKFDRQGKIFSLFRIVSIAG